MSGRLPSDDTATRCAAALLDTVPLVMRSIRHGLRAQAGPDLTVPQFRSLMFLWRSPGAGASTLARHLGLSLPTVSALVQGLTDRGLVVRAPVPGDRRRVALTPSAAGATLVEAARNHNRSRLAGRLAALDGVSQERLLEALGWLHELFGDPPEEEG